MPLPVSLLFPLLLTLLFASCTDEARRGGAGESCTSARDCADSFTCVAQTCVEPGDAAVSSTSAVPSGGSCGTRADCVSGLACVSNVCLPMSLGQAQVGNRYSGRGESCRAKNDCAPPLACVGDVCQMVELPIGFSTKSCHRVECANSEDCCMGFVPNDKCDVYKENCATDPIFCNTYRSLCECRKTCVEELCVEEPPGCKSAAECTSQQTPFCVAGKCRECDSDASCDRDGAKCVDGQCIAACVADEQCPALHRCTDGVCTESGCQTQRECAFYTKDARATCRAGKCQVPCEVDTDCARDDDERNAPASGFQVCEQGQCVFVGCENNAECRALLRIENDEGRVRAICR